MSGSAGVVATTLDEFLNRTNNVGAERVRDIGAGLATAGVLLAVGTLLFLVRVHRGSRAEVRSLILTASVGGVAMLSGAVAELSGIQAVFETGWADVLSVDVSSAPMLRLIGGLLVVFGLTDDVVAVGIDGAPGGGASRARWLPGVDSSFGIVGVVLGVVSFSFDGHTVSKGPRLAHLAADIAHVVAAGAWFGGIIALVIVIALRHRSGRSSADLVIAYSSLATAALVVVAAAGSLMALLILDSRDELTGTEWGRRLLVKLVAVGVAAALGGYHHLVTVPRLSAGGDGADRALADCRTTLVVEALVLAFVVVASVLLVNGVIT